MKRAEHVGVVVARGIGVLLILMALANGVGALERFFPRATSGWSNYSPLTGSSTITPSITIIPPARFDEMLYWETWLHPLAQLLIGSGMILFSRVIGRWLAFGLKESEGGSGEG